MKKEVRKAKRIMDGEEFDDEEDDDDDDDNKEDDVEEVDIKYSEDQVEEEIRKEMEQNDQFCLEEKAMEWSVAEVCNWLKGIQFGPYCRVFMSAQIFGDVLLQDIGTRMLKKFNVTSMHIPKLLRQIKGLRKTVKEKGVK